MCTNAGGKRRAIPLIKHLASDKSHLQTKMLVKIQEDGGDTQDLGSDTAADLQRAKDILSSGGIQGEKKTWQENRVHGAWLQGMWEDTWKRRSIAIILKLKREVNPTIRQEMESSDLGLPCSGPVNPAGVLVSRHHILYLSIEYKIGHPSVLGHHSSSPLYIFFFLLALLFMHTTWHKWLNCFFFLPFLPSIISPFSQSTCDSRNTKLYD